MSTETRDVPAADAALKRGRLVYCAPARLKPWPRLNPREHFDATELGKLEASIRESGVHEPLLVHLPDGDDWSDPLIVAGERRWRAATAAGVAEVPCMVREYSFAEAMAIALLENKQREDLTPLEEARGYRRWLDADPSHSQRQLAALMGLDQSTIANLVGLLKLPDVAQRLIADGVVTQAFARDWLRPFTSLTDDHVREALYSDLAKSLREAWDQAEHVATKEAVRIATNVAKQKSFSLDEQRGQYNQPDHPALAGHHECGCGGPAYPYDAGGWNGGRRKTTRCWNRRWHEQAVERAAAAAKRQKETAKQEVLAKATADKVVKVDARTFRDRFPRAVEIALPHEWTTDGLDPAPLADAQLFVVPVEGRGESKIYVSNPFAAAKARQGFAKHAERIAAELREKRTAADLQAARSLKATEEMLGELLWLDRWRAAGRILEIAAEIGVAPAGQAAVRWGDLGPAERALLAKVVILRVRRNEFDVDPIPGEAAKAAREHFAPALEALLGRAHSSVAQPPNQPGARARRRARREKPAWKPTPEQPAKYLAGPLGSCARPLLREWGVFDAHHNRIGDRALSKVAAHAEARRLNAAHYAEKAPVPAAEVAHA